MATSDSCSSRCCVVSFAPRILPAVLPLLLVFGSKLRFVSSYSEFTKLVLSISIDCALSVTVVTGGLLLLFLLTLPPMTVRLGEAFFCFRALSNRLRSASLAFAKEDDDDNSAMIPAAAVTMDIIIFLLGNGIAARIY